MKQKVLIVEDNIDQNQFLCEVIQENYPEWTIISAHNYTEASDYIAEVDEDIISDIAPFSLFLFDVQLSKEIGDRGGFLLAEELRKKRRYYRTPVLFLTAISDEGGFALSNYHCYNYITKPYSAKDILTQLEQMLITGYLENMLDITDSDRIHHNISANDITYIESKGHVIIIHIGKESLKTRDYTLVSMLRMLGPSFIQIHKRYIVNHKKITHLDNSSFCINIGAAVIPVGRAYKKNLDLFINKR